MPIITFAPENISIEVSKGTNLMTAIIKAELPIGSSCGAIGICAKCFVRVIQGMENLSKPNPIEKKLLEREKYNTDIRISCQAKILGPVTITTSYW
ncbi:MAG: 2Fe-2S iron-sulfur cluster-binding protein [Oligoflexia bacterium]|nr:2Fe-2S iron-sulfur cluster-binding protein [Oligoflexia bacterium]